MPSDSELAQFLDSRNAESLSYREVAATRGKPVGGFDNDHNSIYLGKGDDIWLNAKNALTRWKQFPEPWTRIFQQTTRIEKDKTVAVLFQIFGFWWINSAKIVYTIDEAQRFGYAYGTLPGHLEKGEECFWIEKEAGGAVYYHIKAFSRPAYWIVWAAYPLARHFQKRFVRQSLSTMKKLSNDKTEAHVHRQS